MFARRRKDRVNAGKSNAPFGIDGKPVPAGNDNLPDKQHFGKQPHKVFPASGVKSAVKTKSHGESAIHCPEEVFIQSVGSAQNVSESAGTFVNASCSEAYRRISEARSKRLSNAAAASGQAAKSPDASS